MAAMKCPCCGSPDVVGYWPKRQKPIVNVIASTVDAVLREHYPHAQRCMDCELVMPHGIAGEEARAKAVSLVEPILRDDDSTFVTQHPSVPGGQT
jgi:hypothetical protein